MKGMTDPHVKSSGKVVQHVPLKVVLNPRVHRPPLDDPRREEYDAGLRIVLHLGMILSGMLTVAFLTMLGTDVYMTIMAEGMVPGGIQEIGDFWLHL
jgi:hypothetical protein